MHLTQGGRDNFDLRMLGDHTIDHAKEGTGVELRLGGNIGPRDAQAFLQILFVAHQYIDVLQDAIQHLNGARFTASHVPQFGAVIQVKRNDRTRRLGCPHTFDDDLRCCYRQGGEDTATVEPAHPAGENFRPVKITGLEQAAGLVRTVVEHHRWAHALAAIAIDRSHVRPVDAVVLEVFVKRRDAHGPHGAIDQLTDRIINHCRNDAGLQTEAIGKIGRAVKFTAADVNFALSCFAEGHDATVQTMDESPQGDEIQRTAGRNIQSATHVFLTSWLMASATRVSYLLIS